MANWIVTVDAFDLKEQWEDDGDLLAFGTALAARIEAETEAAGVLDDDLRDKLWDLTDGFIQTTDEMDDCLSDIWDWGDDGARMFLNLSFPPPA